MNTVDRSGEPARNVPGGSILQMMSSRRSSRSLQFGSAAFFGGTTQLSPSGGRQSRMALPKGLYGTSNSRRRDSCSASLLCTLPSARTKCPSGYREVRSHRSMVTNIFCPISAGACLVRKRIRGSSRDTGVANTVCWESEVGLVDVRDVLSM